MRKFLSVIGLIVSAIALLIVGIICVVGLKDYQDLTSIDTIDAANALLIAGTIGGFGGAIGTGIMAIANFFTAKTRDK